ncbi:MAG: RNA polymerase sigma factor [Planctomycetota bacterium]|nr:RNA polymerase sigma factor [Planctomycetota bacterium]
MSDLLSAFKPRIWSICWRTLGHYEDAADLTQDVLVKVMVGIEGFDRRAKFSTWVYRIAVNACMSHLRKQKLRRHPSLDTPATGPEEGGRTTTRGNQVPSREPGPVEGVEHEDELRALEKALGTLDEEPRLLILLRDMHAVEYVQLAEIFEVPVGTIKSRLFRARAALCERMQERGTGER